MGFFSSLCSFVDGFVSSCVGAVCSVVSGVAGAIGAGIAAISSGLAALAAPVLATLGGLGPLVGIVMGVLSALNAIAQMLGVSKKDQEELGADAMMHPEIRPQDYDSVSDYLDALEAAKTPEDEMKRSRMSPDEKIRARFVGAGIQYAGIKEKLDLDVSMDTFADMARCGLTAGEQLDTLRQMKAAGMSPDSFQAAIHGDAAAVRELTAILPDWDDRMALYDQTCDFQYEHARDNIQKLIPKDTVTVDNVRFITQEACDYINQTTEAGRREADAMSLGAQGPQANASQER